MRFLALIVLTLFLGFSSTSCSSSKSKSTVSTSKASGKVISKKAGASYYHDKFNGRKTASGAKFSNKDYTAAHKKLPFGTKLKVTNVANGKSVIVTVTDRGPFKKSRELDLTKRAFMEITDNKNHGVIYVNIQVL